MNPDSRMSGNNGAKRITDTNAYTDLNVDTIIAESAAAFSVCTGVDEQGTVVDFAAAPYNWTAMAVGIPYCVPMGMKVTAITLSSGEIVTY